MKYLVLLGIFFYAAILISSDISGAAPVTVTATSTKTKTKTKTKTSTATDTSIFPPPQQPPPPATVTQTVIVTTTTTQTDTVINISNDTYGRTVQYSSNGVDDSYYVTDFVDPNNNFSLDFPAGTPMSQAYSSINGAAPPWYVPPQGP